jgi:hypothetical protein
MEASSLSEWAALCPFSLVAHSVWGEELSGGGRESFGDVGLTPH